MLREARCSYILRQKEENTTQRLSTQYGNIRPHMSITMRMVVLERPQRNPIGQDTRSRYPQRFRQEQDITSSDGQHRHQRQRHSINRIQIIKSTQLSHFMRFGNQLHQNLPHQTEHLVQHKQLVLRGMSTRILILLLISSVQQQELLQRKRVPEVYLGHLQQHLQRRFPMHRQGLAR